MVLIWRGPVRPVLAGTFDTCAPHARHEHAPRRVGIVSRTGKVSVKRAAALLRLPSRALYAHAHAGAVRVERLPVGTRGRCHMLVDLDELREDLAALRCAAPGCNRRTRGASRFCSHSCAKRLYVPAIVRCAHCGGRFWVPGHVAHAPGRGRFCSASCSTSWWWAHQSREGTRNPPYLVAVDRAQE